jgi:hypothetical protein
MTLMAEGGAVGGDRWAACQASTSKILRWTGQLARAHAELWCQDGTMLRIKICRASWDVGQIRISAEISRSLLLLCPGQGWLATNTPTLCC